MTLTGEAKIEQLINASMQASEQSAKKPARGRVVRVVVASKKVPAGVVGTVGWIGNDRFRHTMTRLGVYAVDGAIHYVNASEVEVVAWEQYMPSRETVAWHVAQALGARQ